MVDETVRFDIEGSLLPGVQQLNRILERMDNSIRDVGRESRRGFRDLRREVNQSNRELRQTGIELRGITRSFRLLQRIGAGAIGFIGVRALVRGTRELATEYADLSRTIRFTQATIQGTQADYNALRDIILEVSGASRFASRDIAEGTRLLSFFGLEIQNIEASLPVIERFATAADDNIENSTRLLVSSANQFRLGIEQINRVSDVFVQAGREGAATAQEIGDAFRNAGAQSAAFGRSFEETVAVLTQVSNLDLIGAPAGTALNAFLRDSARNTNEFRERLSEFGLTMDDVNLSVNTYQEVIQNLADSTIESADIANVFTDESARLIVPLLEAQRASSDLTGEIEQLTSGLRTAGGATNEFARRMDDDFSFAIDRASSTLETLRTNIGVLLEGPATSFLDWFSDVATAANDATVALQDFFGVGADADDSGGATRIGRDLNYALGFNIPQTGRPRGGQQELEFEGYGPFLPEGERNRLALESSERRYEEERRLAERNAREQERLRERAIRQQERDAQREQDRFNQSVSSSLTTGFSGGFQTLRNHILNRDGPQLGEALGESMMNGTIDFLSNNFNEALASLTDDILSGNFQLPVELTGGSGSDETSNRIQEAANSLADAGDGLRASSGDLSREVAGFAMSTSNFEDGAEVFMAAGTPFDQGSTALLAGAGELSAAATILATAGGDISGAAETIEQVFGNVTRAFAGQSGNIQVSSAAANAGGAEGRVAQRLLEIGTPNASGGATVSRQQAANVIQEEFATNPQEGLRIVRNVASGSFTPAPTTAETAPSTAATAVSSLAPRLNLTVSNDNQRNVLNERIDAAIASSGPAIGTIEDRSNASGAGSLLRGFFQTGVTLFTDPVGASDVLRADLDENSLYNIVSARIRQQYPDFSDLQVHDAALLILEQNPGLEQGIPGFQQGGLLQIRGRPGVDNNILYLNDLSNPIARVSDQELLTFTPANDNVAGGPLAPLAPFAVGTAATAGMLALDRLAGILLGFRGRDADVVPQGLEDQPFTRFGRRLPVPAATEFTSGLQPRIRPGSRFANPGIATGLRGIVTSLFGSGARPGDRELPLGDVGGGHPIDGYRQETLNLLLNAGPGASTRDLYNLAFDSGNSPSTRRELIDLISSPLVDDLHDLAMQNLLFRRLISDPSIPLRHRVGPGMLSFNDFYISRRPPYQPNLDTTGRFTHPDFLRREQDLLNIPEFGINSGISDPTIGSLIGEDAARRFGFDPSDLARRRFSDPTSFQPNTLLPRVITDSPTVEYDPNDPLSSAERRLMELEFRLFFNQRGRFRSPVRPPFDVPPRLNQGGTVRLGGNPGIDRNRLFLNNLSNPIADVSRNELLTVTPANDNAVAGGGMSITVRPTYIFGGSGNVNDPATRARMKQTTGEIARLVNQEAARLNERRGRAA